MDVTEAMLYASVTGLIVGCYVASLKYLYKCKFTNISCCGIQIQRDVDTERNIEEGIRRTSSGTPVLTQLFSGRATI